MDLALAILSGILIFIGIIGSVLPVLPGSPLCWLGILLVHFTEYADFSTSFLVITAVAMVVVTILDYFIPIWGTRKFGGTRAGVTGSTLGLVLGIFFPPFGIILGPFIGALAGELIANQKEFKKAFRSATGSFMGFLLGTGLKLIYGGLMAFYFFKAVLT